MLIERGRAWAARPIRRLTDTARGRAWAAVRTCAAVLAGAAVLSAAAALAGAAAAVTAYLRFVRPRTVRWGATDEEVRRHMPGDEIVANPTLDATRAVTIDAPPAEIWPWLVQIGYKRAGWYSYDLVDNLGRRSAEEILPEHQDLSDGDLIPLIDEFGYAAGFWVKELDPPNSMLWWDKKQMSWLWMLVPLESGETRLITRVRMRYHWLRPSILFELALDVGDIVMMRKCMLGIKRRAEAATRAKRRLPDATEPRA